MRLQPAPTNAVEATPDNYRELFLEMGHESRCWNAYSNDRTQCTSGGGPLHGRTRGLFCRPIPELSIVSCPLWAAIWRQFKFKERRLLHLFYHFPRWTNLTRFLRILIPKWQKLLIVWIFFGTNREAQTAAKQLQAEGTSSLGPDDQYP